MKRPTRTLLFALAVICCIGAPPTPASVILDVDDSGMPEAATDGLLVVRYLFGFSGSILSDGAVAPAARRDTAAIERYLDLIRPELDVDGTGGADALTDGLLIWRYLSGLTGPNLVNGAVAPGAPNSTPEVIEPILAGLMTKILLPPDPADVAPPLDRTVATTVYASTRFLYTGEDPIQTGVAGNSIEPRRAAMIRGRVLDHQGDPLPGVSVTVLGHPEFGQTLSRDDGMFDLGVNGGGRLTVDYRRAGYLPAQRRVQVPWQDHAFAPDVVLVAPEPIVTPVDLNAPGIQVARGSIETDVDGTRQATLLVPAGTRAELVLADGSTQPVDRLSLRLTEYTIGPEGPEAMPAELPPTTGYTYALEVSADEVVAKVGGKDVIFSQPVPLYLEDFIGFPVGSAVPTGYYDQTEGQWLASENGRVIKILGIASGLAEIDADGDDVADDLPNLDALGITEAERERLVGLYAPGQTLWRIPLPHLSTWDFNWPFGPPPDAEPPKPPKKPPEPPEKSCNSAGSIITCQAQALGERVPVTGTPLALHYRSDRVPGRRDAYMWNIPLTGDTVPTDLVSVELAIRVAGREFRRSFQPAPQLAYEFVWDGKDAQGRLMQGTQSADARIGYAYQGRYYAVSSEFERSFAGVRGSAGSVGSVSFTRPMRAGNPIVIWAEATALLGGWTAPDLGLGGWTLDIHHAYGTKEKALYKGDGTKRRGALAGSLTISGFAGTGISGFSGDGGSAAQALLASPLNPGVAPDGSVYIADSSNHRVRRVRPDGIIETVAGIGECGFSGDAGPATEAKLCSPRDVEVAANGSFYIVDSCYYGSKCVRVRHVNAEGAISTVAGTGVDGYGGDGGSATEADVRATTVALAADGSLYIAEAFNRRIRRVGPDGIITTVAGTGEFGSGGDGGLAIEAPLPNIQDVAVAPDGSFLIADDYDRRIRRVGLDGIITTVAGDGSTVSFSEAGKQCDGRKATDAAIYPIGGVSAAPEGGFYFGNGAFICRVGAGGYITKTAGTGENCYSADLYCGDGGFANQARLSPRGLDVGPDGALYVATGAERVRRIESILPGFTFTDLALADEDGTEFYRFDEYGRHLSTLSTLTGTELYRFAYDAGGRLVEIGDSDGNLTLIERDTEGEPTAIVAPGGQRTVLSVTNAGYLASITNSAEETIRLEYDEGGLLSAFEDAKGNRSEFAYDEAGRLVRDADAAGGSITLARSEQATGYTVTKTTAVGRVNTYRLEYLPSGAERSVKTDPSGAVMDVLTDIDGTSTLSFPDGTVVVMEHGPDPRFGMQVPILNAFSVTTPSGLTRGIIGSREVSLSEPGNPLSLLTQKDTFAVNGRTYRYLYDADTRRLTATAPEGQQSASELDEAARVIRIELGEGVDPILLTHDARGLITQLAQGSESLTYAYDEQRRITSRTDGVGVETSYTHDAVGRVIGVDLPGGTEAAYAYDANGNRTLVTMPSGADHTLNYTVRDLFTEYSAPDNPILKQTYDQDRARVMTTLPGGRVITNAFDQDGRWIATTYPEASIAFQQDTCCGRLETLTRTPVARGASQTVSYTYDGELITGQNWSGAATGDFTYAYDDDFFPTQMELQSGSDSVVIPFSFNADGQLTDNGSFTLSRGGPGGAVSEVSDGVLTLTLSHDSLARVQRRDYKANGTPVYSFELTRDDAARVTRKVETTVGETHTFDYTYDGLGQLTEVRRDGSLIQEYTYDVNGNRLSTLSTTADYDSQDQLTRFGTTDYQFDVDGFLIGRGGDLFTYSARGELLEARLGSGETITYDYDGLERRVGRTDSSGSTQYLYGDPGRPFSVTAVRDPAGTLSVFYYDDKGLPFAMERGGERYFIATDPLGTPQAVFRAQDTVKTLEYDAFGVVISDSNPGFVLPIGFGGGLADPATGLVRFGYRDYDPPSGRWTARDPILFRGGQLNLYAYVGNDPVNLRDPLGLWCAGGGLFHGVGAGGQLCCSSGGMCSWCYEIGVGFSRSAGLGTGDPQAEGVDIASDLSATYGPGGIGLKCKHNWKCGLQCEAEGNLGPVKYNTGSGFSLELSPSAKNAKRGAGAKLAIRECIRFAM